jgi:hypothetical protein
MNNTKVLVCDHISYKCKMRELLIKVSQQRHQNILGTLGPARFTTIPVFLRKANKNSSVNDGVYNIQKNDQFVVAIGDVHGDLLALLSALYLGGMINADGFWCGGNNMVVQLGDILDRGGRGVSQNTSKNPREEVDILQYLHALNTDAQKSGGVVVSLVGNHESEKFSIQKKSIDEYETELLVQGWGGVKEKRRLFTPGSELATYFAKFKPVIVQVNDFIFCHGGIVPDMIEPSDTIRSMNKIWRDFLTGKITRLPDRIQQIYWNRDLSLPDPKDTEANKECVLLVGEVFRKLHIPTDGGGIVVAHTVQDKGIPFYCDGKVWRVDVALSEAFGRRNKPIEVLKIIFNVCDWSGKTVVQIIKGLQDKSAKTTRSSTEIHNFVGGDLTWVDKISRVQRN